MAELANFLLEMETPHPDFRVWITTEPHKDFPVSLLQMSIKYTYEPPQGNVFFICLNKNVSLRKRRSLANVIV